MANDRSSTALNVLNDLERLLTSRIGVTLSTYECKIPALRNQPAAGRQILTLGGNYFVINLWQKYKQKIDLPVTFSYRRIGFSMSLYFFQIQFRITLLGLMAA